MRMLQLYIDNGTMLCYNRFIETIIFSKIHIKNDSVRRLHRRFSERNASKDLPFIATDDRKSSNITVHIENQSNQKVCRFGFIENDAKRSNYLNLSPQTVLP